jgi:hypothetical protein
VLSAGLEIAIPATERSHTYSTATEIGHSGTLLAHCFTGYRLKISILLLFRYSLKARARIIYIQDVSREICHASEKLSFGYII